MSTATLDPTIQQLVDHRAVEHLLTGLGHWLDGAGGDPADIYDPDVVVHSPRGEFRGLDEILARVAPSNDDDGRTQHFFTDVVVEVDGDRAVAHANQLVQFFLPGEPPHRTSGLRVRYELARRGDGWRLTGAEHTLAWLVGDLPT